MDKGSVLIIGAGMSGLAVARYLRPRGFRPLLLESHTGLGGQWNRQNPLSGVWPEMRTNTARFVTRFSDLRYPEGVPMFPRNGEVLDLLRDWAGRHGLLACCRFGARVTSLARSGGGYRVEWEEDGAPHSRDVDRVVVATGRFNRPQMPAVPGIEDFTGACGVVHTLHYKDPLAFRDRRIVVLGGSISALEVASDQAMMGSRVWLAQRRQRYVMPKMIAGTPLEYYAFTREGALALETSSLEEILVETKNFLETHGGNPAAYGAPAPHEDMAEAGVTGSQHYLNLVAEDRIDLRPPVVRVEGDRVTFGDGSTVAADAILVGTGFDLHLPFLSREIADTVNLTGKGLELAEFTFHPELPGLAFAGLWAQLGPYPVVLEQQARWIAYAWGGDVPAPTEAELRRGVEACVAEDHHGDYRQQHEMAIRFARLAATDPAAVADPELCDMLAKSAVTGEMFRITGPDSLPGAEAEFRRAFWRYAPPEVRREIRARHGGDESGNGPAVR